MRLRVHSSKVQNSLKKNFWPTRGIGRLGASCKAQVKIQQMGFVLVALMVFFAIVLLVWISLSQSDLEGDVATLREMETIEIVRTLSNTPEFMVGASDCANCVDFDKVFVLSEQNAYEGFWARINYLEIRRVAPTFNTPCARGTYPKCDSIILIDAGGDTVTQSAFVALCRYDATRATQKCELGKLIAGFDTP